MYLDFRRYMIGMAFYWFFFANNMWGGVESLILFLQNISISLGRLNMSQTRFIYNWLNGHWIIANSWNIAVTFLGIRCVVTLDNFPRTSRPLKWPLPNIIMKLLVFPYLFTKGVSRMSNCLSLWVRFSISCFFQDTRPLPGARTCKWPTWDIRGGLHQ